MTARATLCVSSLLLLSPIPAPAQYPNIQVSSPGSTDPEEVTIAINPIDPLNLAAGANITYSYYSLDGGWTWNEGILSSTLGVWGDPCVAFDGAGNLYYAHLSWPPAGDWLDRIVVQKSLDGGITWDDGVGVGLNPPKEQDKEWLAADLTDSPWQGNLYLAWTEFDDIGSSSPSDSSRILFSRSTTAGATWSDPIRISEVGGNCQDDDHTVEGAVPAVGPQGEVYLSWAGHELIWFDSSTDGGVTFGSDEIVTTQPGGWEFSVPGIYRCNGFPVTACDISTSPYRGRVYISWSDQRNGLDDTDVFLITSTDGGQTWGPVVRVNDDVGAAHQFFPWMTVDPLSGVIYLVFYDRRATAGNATEVWMARSDDGGDTFTNFRVSETSFTPVSNVFFGDYINIAARDGRVYPIWMRMDGGLLSVWMAILTEPVSVDPDTPWAGQPDLLAGLRNPWSRGAPISLELPEAATVSLSIYDVKGRLVQTLVDGPVGPGSHAVTWSARTVSAGVYFIDVRANRHQVRKKLVVLP